MQFKFILSALALLATSSSLVQADSVEYSEEHQLDRRGGKAGKVFAIVGGITATLGGILTLQPELVTFGAAMGIMGSAAGTVSAIVSRRDLKKNLGAALVAAEPDLSLHSTHADPSGNWTNFVLSGRNLQAGNAVWMELTHYHKTNRIDALVVGSKTGLNRRQAANGQQIKVSFNILSQPQGGYDADQLNRFAKSMSDAVASAKTDTSCHGSVVDGKAAWTGKITIGTLDELKNKEVVNDCTQDPNAYGQYFSEERVFPGDSFVAGGSFLAI
ncbi:hypothetical protein HDU97_000355 [Phlyctochytrium planicorne]|nr:hypothetical protein HDU97_000355 [Phlyctochytrium planicorne]